MPPIKLFDLDFTRISGSYLIDNIGNYQVPFSGTNIPTHSLSAPAFLLRSGISWVNENISNQSRHYIDFNTIDKFRLCSTDNYRTLFFWFYLPKPVISGDTTMWSSNQPIWTEGGSSSGISIIRNSITQDIAILYSGTAYTDNSNILATSGIKLVCVSYSSIYISGSINSQIVGCCYDHSGNSLPPENLRKIYIDNKKLPTSSPVNPYLGESSSSSYLHLNMLRLLCVSGYLFYDSSENDSSYYINELLPDSIYGNNTVDTLSGNISGVNISGYKAVAIESGTKISSISQVNDNGFYSLPLGNSGNHTLVILDPLGKAVYTTLMDITPTGIIFYD